MTKFSFEWKQIHPKGRCCEIRYRLPGKDWQRKSLGTHNERTARRRAQELLSELEAQVNRPDGFWWDELVRMYWDEHMSMASRAHQASWGSACRRFDEFKKIDEVSEITSAVLSSFSSHLVGKLGLERSTARSYVKYIRGALSWAYGTGRIDKMPAQPRVKRGELGGKMRGRAITGEEFERMLEAAPLVMGGEAAESWRHVMRGLFIGGLRIGDVIKLRWDQTPGGLWVAADCLALVADRLGDKRGKAEEIPIVPEFSEFLKSRQRDRGMVFEPIGIRGRPIRSKEEVGRRITEIALRACVKATSHDLRRGFATFWARHVMPAVLQRLMRHADIKTTMKFYVDIDVRSLTAELSQGATLGATAPNRENTLRG